MKIYTKTGDAGTTALFGGERVPKAHLRIDAYGTVDELNSVLGMVRDQPVTAPIQLLLTAIQNNLFTIGAILATEPGNTKVKTPPLLDSEIMNLETAIDAMETELPPLKNFILPGGHPSVSWGHIARTVCRRAERLVVALHQQQPVEEKVIKYLNRLSDYLFVLCRWMALKLDGNETPWIPLK